MSVDVEQVFSRGRMLLSYEGNCLSAESTRVILCLREWVRLDLLTADELEEITMEMVKPDELDERDGYNKDEWVQNRHIYID